MYIPPYYREKDHQILVSFMKAHNFANLVSVADNIPIATHLPFVLEERDEKLFLVSHMAKANPQWESFNENELLVIFQGPHAYISPDHYEKQQNVPTWNYIAVHAYGKAKIIDDPTDVWNLMERTIHNFEEKFFAQWKSLSPEYVSGMLKAIVAFEIEVTRLDGKFKLSQNKTKNEQQHIISSFEKSEDSVQREIAKEMKKKMNQ
jgi:transcriptional regulator